MTESQETFNKPLHDEFLDNRQVKDDSKFRGVY